MQQKKSYERGKNIRHVKPSIDRLKRGNAARIQINKNIILIILVLTKNWWNKKKLQNWL